MIYQVCWSVSETTDEIQVSTDCVKRVDDGAIIPFDSANYDYLEYLEWLEEEGNEPLPPD